MRIELRAVVSSLAAIGLVGVFATSALAGPKPVPANFKCPKAQAVKTQCMGPKDCVYPHTADKTAFIQCTMNPDGQSATPVAMPCPDGLMWNNRKKACDLPKNATGL